MYVCTKHLCTGTVYTVAIDMRERVSDVHGRADVPALHVLEPSNLLTRVRSIGLDLHTDTEDATLLLGLSFKKSANVCQCAQKQLAGVSAQSHDVQMVWIMISIAWLSIAVPIDHFYGMCQGLKKQEWDRVISGNAHLSLDQSVHGR
jgi:hypothetical protein